MVNRNPAKFEYLLMNEIRFFYERTQTSKAVLFRLQKFSPIEAFFFPDNRLE